MQRTTLVPPILAAAVLSLLGMQIATSMRLAKLQDQITKLDPAPAAGSADPVRPGSSGSTDSAVDASDLDGHGGGALPAGSLSKVGVADGGHAPAGGKKPVLSKTDGPLSETDIEALIDKKIAERDKKHPFAQIMNFEDPLVVMERELKLSPIQKTRIQQHFKERDDATMDLWQTEEGRKDWRGTEEKAAEFRKKCEESVKRELDLAQQDKYDELKKAGKISDFGGAGMSIVIDSKGEAAPNGTDGGEAR
ncbi:MAG: hypothetical protein AAB074_14125 [Planctomycetota bacterium]